MTKRELLYFHLEYERVRPYALKNAKMPTHTFENCPILRNVYSENGKKFSV